MKSVAEATPPAIPPARQTPLSARSSESAGPMATMMLIYLVVVVGRIGDIVPGMHSIPLAKIVALLAIILAATNWSKLPAVSVWSLPPARLTIFIMVLATFSMVFSVLRHATLGVITGTVLSVSVGMVLMIKSARNWPATRRLLLGCVLSALVLAASVEITRHAGRAGSDSDLDPNDFAFILVGLLPLVLAFASLSRGLKKISFIVAALWVVFEILRTESRGGLLGLLCVVLLMMALAPTRRRGRLVLKVTKATIVARILILVMVGIVAWHAIPDSARTRLARLEHPTSGYNTNLSDPTGRFSIWLQALHLAIHRPWGWGAGAFATADGMYAGGRYKAPHNMYIQALTELGVLGLALFLATLLSGFRRLKREAFSTEQLVDHSALERRIFAKALIASLTGICVSGFFLSELYSQVVWAVVTLTCIVGRSAETTDAPPQTANARQ